MTDRTSAPCSASWIDFDGSQQLENGRYEIEGSDDNYDPELPPGQIEIYDHPVRGQSFWDSGGDDGSDYAGHISPFYLGRVRLRLLQQNVRPLATGESAADRSQEPS
jgi:hypothetical protein